MLKRILAGLLTVVLFACLSGCTFSAAGGLKSYVDSIDGYEFLYPNGWLPVTAAPGVDIAFRDLIEQTENVSVVFEPVSTGKTLQDLGTPGEVGYQLGKNAIAPPNSNRKAELVAADSKEVNGKTYYVLEYEVQFPDQIRHNLASVVVSRGKLYTFNASTSEARWQKVGDLLRKVVNSFSAY